MAKAKLKKRNKKKDVTEPDEFILTVSSAFSYLMEHKLMLVGSILAILLVVVAVGGTAYYRNSYVQRASMEFGDSLQYFHAGAEATPANATAIKNALKGFKKVTKEYSVSPFAKYSRLYIARCYQLLGKTDRAIEEYKTALQKLGEEPLAVPWRVTAAYADQSELKEMEALLGKNGVMMEPYLRYSLAMLYETKGEKEKAIAELKKVKDQFPSSPFAEDARKALELLK